MLHSLRLSPSSSLLWNQPLLELAILARVTLFTLAMEQQQTETAQEPSATDSTSPHKPTIHTYHCLCTNLVLATTYPLTSLQRRRADPALDHALILPKPPTPRHLARPRRDDADPASSSSSDDEDDDDHETTSAPPPPASGDVTITLSLPRAAQPIVVRRSDGFEKRWLLRCGRCALVVGYQLDGAQFGRPGEGRREDVLYLLPGAVVETAEMAEGKRVGEAEVAFGLAEGTGG